MLTVKIGVFVRDICEKKERNKIEELFVLHAVVSMDAGDCGDGGDAMDGRCDEHPGNPV